MIKDPQHEMEMERIPNTAGVGSWLLMTMFFAGACFAQQVKAQDGALDQAYTSSDGDARIIYAAAQLPDGKVLIGGNIPPVNFQRLNADGTIDTSLPSGTGFTGGIPNHVWSILSVSDEQVLVGGCFTTFNGTAITNLARIGSDGLLDPTFDSGTGPRLASGGPVIGSIYNITPQPDGKLVIGGMFDEYDGHIRSCLARIDANGALDPDFHVGAGVRSGSTVGAVWSIARQDDGKLLLSGLFTTYDGVARKNLARVNADGSLDATFNTGGGPNNVVRAVAVQPDGKVLIAGPFTAYDQVPRAGVARLHADGSLDTSFDPGAGAAGNAGPDLGGASLLLQVDGKIILGGWFNTFNTVSRNNLVRLHADGSVDLGFDPGTGLTEATGGGERPAARCIVPGTGGTLLVGGNLRKYDGTARNGFVRIINSAIVNVGEFEPLPVGVYPNPFHDKVIVELTAGAGKQPFTVHDAVGKQVASGVLNGQRDQVDLQALPAGVYVMRLQAGSPQSIRLVKQ